MENICFELEPRWILPTGFDCLTLLPTSPWHDKTCAVEMSAWHVKPECINGLTVYANSLLRWLGWSEPDTQCCLVVCLNLKSKWLLHVPSSLNPQTLFQFSELKPPDHCFFINVLPGAQKLRVLGLRSNWFICIADSQSQHQALMCLWRENLVTIHEEGTVDTCTSWLLWSSSFLCLNTIKHLLSSCPHPAPTADSLIDE